MSSKTAEERQMEKDQELVQKILLGEVTPDLIQSYRIIKNCVDAAIQKGVYTAGDTVLLVRAFDTLRNHINEFNGINPEKKEEKAVESTEEIVDEVEETVEETVEESKKKRPPRKKR